MYGNELDKSNCSEFAIFVEIFFSLNNHYDINEDGSAPRLNNLLAEESKTKIQKNSRLQIISIEY